LITQSLLIYYFWLIKVVYALLNTTFVPFLTDTE
jgi:hypothetical protein